jgi:hypothetical protein
MDADLEVILEATSALEQEVTWRTPPCLFQRTLQEQ